MGGGGDRMASLTKIMLYVFGVIATCRNVDGDRAKNVTIAATAGTARFTFELRTPNFHKNLNISLDVCTFAVHLEL